MNAIALRLFTFLLAHVPDPSPLQTITVQVPPDKSQRLVLIAQTIVLLAQTAVLSTIAVWTFYSGSKQKMRERRGAWYQKAVVDHLLPALASFFKKQNELLTIAAARCSELRDNPDTGILLGHVKSTIAEFKDELHSVGEICERTAVFDSALRSSLRGTFDGLEESVSEWFDIHAFSRSRLNAKKIRELLFTCETTVIKKLYDFEFEKFG